MKKRVLSTVVLAFLVSAFTLTSCSSDDNSKPGGGDDDEVIDDGDREPEDLIGTKYILGASASKTNLLLEVDNLKEGSISVRGNGKTALGKNIYMFKDLRAYVFEYRKGDPSGMQSWLLNKDLRIQENTLVDLPNREEFIQPFGRFMISTTGGIELENGKKGQAFNFINGVTGAIEFTSFVNVENIAEQGEYANFAGLEDIGNDRFVMAIEPFKITANSDQDNTSAFRDRAWLAIFKLDMSQAPENRVVLEGVVKDDRMSFAVARYRSSRVSTIGKGANGDIYVFSPSAMISQEKGAFSTKPSAVLKFDKNTLKFDSSYYFDLEAKSGGHKVYKVYAVGKDQFILNMFANTDQSWNMAPANKLALFNAKTGQFQWINGLEDPALIAEIGTPYVEGDEVFVPITAAAKSYVYLLNRTTATFTKGLEIKDLGDGTVGNVVKIASYK
ncbi:DUF4374 domain-containing protein [Myroides odoratus]|uniref:DUF4374 domain-containing protein n=1 Tax=Myroides odoratus TaxID=256 RepID=A0A378U5D4_MYROD|nr:DUF4374 domain-containing protein [Myroides odoratus]MCS4239479.1 hypothetical protein [Myroides odoratus]MDH6601326.1 hypothetical protein [Myroides gitamensis]QQU02567.1 DUF4374 domain-containing protein [Myroides odoratus]STZ70221.1 Uncharacterised protein [Myroides odoratus]